MKFGVLGILLILVFIKKDDDVENSFKNLYCDSFKIYSWSK
jgi:hypothetical protein